MALWLAKLVLLSLVALALATAAVIMAAVSSAASVNVPERAAVVALDQPRDTPVIPDSGTDVGEALLILGVATGAGALALASRRRARA
jgi:hypothetical protein